MSIDIDQALDWRGRTVVDRDGRKIGVFEEIYLDEDTNEPAWAAVRTGRFRLRRRVVPVADAERFEDGVRVPFTKDDVRSAPTIDSDGWVSERDQATILRHYGVASERATEAGPGDAPTGPVHDADDDPDADEQAARASRRLRLNRYTVTETVTRRSEFGDE
jgi:sporulation protein YlmC with PRC-barrel domain